MKKTAFIAGMGYVLIFISGIYANFFVLGSLKVPGDSLLTFQNMVNSRSLLKTGISAFIVMVLSDLVLTWCLYVLFRRFNENLSKITAWFRLVNVVLFGVALHQLLDIVQSTTHHAEYADLGEKYPAYQVEHALTSFNDTWLLGLIFFGIHLILLSTMMLKYGGIPRYIPTLLIIAGLGYLTDSFLQINYSNYEAISEISNGIVVMPGVIGELSLTFWLFTYKNKEGILLDHSH